MSSGKRRAHEEAVFRVMESGRENGARSIIFHQAVAQVLGLNATDTRCLDLVLRHGPASPTELAQLTGLTTGAVTVLIDRLEKAGLIQRRPSPEDRRRTLLVTTPKTMKVLGPLYAPMARSMHALFSRYTTEELALFANLLTRMTELWKSETARVLKETKRR